MAQPPKLLELAKSERMASGEAFCKAGWEAHGRAASASAVPGKLACKLARSLLPLGKLARKRKPCCGPRRMPCPAGFGMHPAGPEGRHYFLLCHNEARRKAMPGMAAAARKGSE